MPLEDWDQPVQPLIRIDPAAWSNVTYTLSTVTTGVLQAFDAMEALTDAPPEGEEDMATIVKDLAQLADAPEGTVVAVDVGGGDGSRMDHWRADGEGNLTKDDVSLPAVEFQSAINNQTVYIIRSLKIGDSFVGGAYYRQIIDQEGEDWVIAKSNSRGAAATLSVSVGQPSVTWRSAGVLPSDVQTAMDFMKTIRQAEKDSARLAEILDHGEVPTNESYRVTVQVHGKQAVELNATQAAEFLAVGGVEVTAVGAFLVRFIQTTTIGKRTRWGCACSEVTQADIDQALPRGDAAVWGTWNVVGCEPIRKGAESTVHKVA